MYSIIKDNVEIGVTERPTYIRLTGEGAYTPCEEAISQGVAYEGVPYHVWGKPEMTGTEESVALVTVDAGTLLHERLGEIADKSDNISSLTFTLAGALADMAEMILDLQTGGTPA